MLSKELLQAWYHSKNVLFFIRRLNGWYFRARFEMNLLRYAIFSCKLFNSWMFLGSTIFRITSIFAWSISISRWRIMKPKNFPKVTPNEHFKGIILSWYLLVDQTPSLSLSSGHTFPLISLLNHQHNIQYFLWRMLSKKFYIDLWYVSPAYFKLKGITLLH